MPDAFKLDTRIADRSDTELLSNLLSYYLYDLSEWFIFDTSANGSFDYDLDEFWDAGGVPYLAHVSGMPAGFALVEPIEQGYDLKEFFILRRYRSLGVSQAFCKTIWDQRPGTWQVRVFTGNKPAVPFWSRVIAEYTGNQHVQETVEIDESLWTHYRFTSR